MRNIFKRFLTLFLVLGSVITFISLGNKVKVTASDLPSYYDSIDFTGLYGENLKSELRTLISKNHTPTSYTDCKNPDLIEQTDGDPDNPGNIILFWSGLSIDSAWDGSWNREHVWPQSQGWFSESGAGADLHHIRPTDVSVNSSHGNRPYGIVSEGKYVGISSTNGGGTTMCKVGGSIFEPCDEKKGDAARIIFYLLTRYSQADSYSITNVATSMDLLLEWNANDPVDASETRRNDAVHNIQGNRNPFIDDSNFANLIWDYNGEVVQSKGKINLTYDSNHASVVVNGTKDGNGYYSGRVEITVTLKSNIAYSGIKDLSTSSILTTSTTYVISNITKDYNLEIVTAEGSSSGGSGEIPDTPIIQDGSYALVTANSQLTVGSQIVITAADYDYAISTTQNNNNRAQTSIVKASDKSTLTSVSDEVQVLTLVNGNIAGTYGLYTGSGYLTTASSSSNYLRTDSSLTDNSSWLINISSDGVASVVAQGTYSRNIMRYNSGSSLFGCYATGQKDISIYLLSEESSSGEEIDNSLTEFADIDTLSSLNLGYKEDKTQASANVSNQFTLPAIGITTNTTVTIGNNYASSFGLDASVFSVTFGKSTTSVTTPALNQNDGIRLYSTSTSNGSWMVITSNTGYAFSGINITQASGNARTLTVYVQKAVDGEWEDAGNITNSSSKLTFNQAVYGVKVANYSGAKGFISSLTIDYSDVVTETEYDLVYTAIRFGTIIEASLYEALMAKGENVYFGVAAAKQANLEALGKTLYDLLGDSKYFFSCSPVRVNAYGEADAEGDYYQFALVLTNVPKDSLDAVVTAACYVSIDGEITMMNPVSKSVKDVASAYLSNDTSAIEEYVGILQYVSEYTKE